MQQSAEVALKKLKQHLDATVFLLRIPVRRALRRPARLLVLLLSIGLATALVHAMLEAGEAAVGGFERRAVALGGDSQAVVVRSARGTIDLAMVRERGRELGDGLRVVPILEANVKVQCGVAQRNVLLLGLDALRLSRFFGESPGTDLIDGAGGVVASALLRDCGFERGGVVDLHYNDVTAPLKIVGDVQALNTVALGAGIITSIPVAQRVLGNKGGITSLLILAPKGEATTSLKERLIKMFPQLVVHSLAEERQGARELTAAFRTNIGILILVSLLLALLLVLHTTELSLTKIRQSLELLRVCGLNGWVAGCLYLGEIVLATVVGVAGGTALGFPVSRAIATLLMDTIEAFYVPNATAFLPEWGAARGYGIGLVVGGVVLVTLIPLWKRLRMPLSLGESGGEPETSAPALWRWGILLMIAWGVVTVYATYSLARTFAYASAFLLFAAVMALTPAAVTMTAHFLRRHILHSMRVPGLLAMAQISSRIVHSRLSLGVVSVGVALIVGTEVFVGSFRVSLMEWAQKTFFGDVYIRPEADGDGQNPARLGSDVSSLLGLLPGIRKLHPVYISRELVGEKFLTVRGEAMDQVGASGALVGISAGEVAVCRDRGGVFLSESASRRFAVGIDAHVAIGGVPTPVCGVYREYTKEEGVALIDSELFLSRYGMQPPQSIAVLVSQGANPEDVAGEIGAALKGRSVRVVTTARLREIVGDVFEETFQITAVMSVIVAFVAALSLVLSALQHALERAEENILYRTLGVRFSEFLLGTTIEALVLVMPGVVLGAGAGVLLGYLLVGIINPATFGWSLRFVVDCADIVLPVVIIAVATLLSAILSAPLAILNEVNEGKSMWRWRWFGDVKRRISSPSRMLLGCLFLATALLGASAPVRAESSDLTGPRFEVPSRERRLQFPRDHGVHPSFQTEWWYLTGQLRSDGGDIFELGGELGFQLTFFRRLTGRLGLSMAEVAEDKGEFRQIYLAHGALSDMRAKQYSYESRIANGGLGIAGGALDSLRVWHRDWSMAIEGDVLNVAFAVNGGCAVHLSLPLRPSNSATESPLVLHGDRGFSKKGMCNRCASHYYSLVRLQTEGEVRCADAPPKKVRGLAWFDHEFMSEALSESVQGWDWLSLMFRDGSNLMLARVRGAGPSGGDYFLGTLSKDGAATNLSSDEIIWDEKRWWESPHSSAKYPVGVHVKVPRYGIDEVLMPLLDDQEHVGERAAEEDTPTHSGEGGMRAYWEGAVAAESRNGIGYLELTGYTGSREKM